ncbi:hypothetical protein NP493_780g01016 [Ridgeia piscesae]|uniref:Uncharacterized protein n=1 Tax=Ridgeia piscesae TaxID=27915 RepID=A0AAD9KNR3_RIDPI|nr:hypothetical protein NP493_780g01016 [Ridgeia piscesae]
MSRNMSIKKRNHLFHSACKDWPSYRRPTGFTFTV